MRDPLLRRRRTADDPFRVLTPTVRAMLDRLDDATWLLVARHVHERDCDGWDVWAA